MQLEIMLFFQRIQNPFFSFLANLFSAFGEESLMIIILLTIYWAVDKKKGFVIFSSLFLSLGIMQTLKAIVRAPRPFEAHPELIDAGRIETATGYSFPSGHSTGSASLYSAILISFRSIWIKTAAFILIVAVPLSRLYLGVHWPIDVTFGLIIGLGVSVFLSNLFASIYDDKRKLRRIYVPLGTLLTLVSLLMAILLHLSMIDETAFSDFMKMLAVFSTAAIGGAVEINSSDFVPPKRVRDKIISILLGLAIIIIIQGTKAVISEKIYYLWSFVRYALTGIAATLLIPRLMIKLGIMKERKYYTDMFRDVI